MPRKPPHWKPHRTGTIENLFGNIPSTDTVFIPIINEKGPSTRSTGPRDGRGGGKGLGGKGVGKKTGGRKGTC